MAQMGVDEVIWGRLTDAMRVPDGGTVDAGGFIHPRVEPEVAFLLDRLPEPGETVGDFADAVRAVAPAIELIDSRYADFSFSLPDVIADNTSAAAFVVGALVAGAGRAGQPRRAAGDRRAGGAGRLDGGDPR